MKGAFVMAFSFSDLCLAVIAICAVIIVVAGTNAI